MILLASSVFQCENKLPLGERVGVHLKEFARKNAANALSVANMVMGMTSILCILNGQHHAACWLVLIGYMLDLADGAVARRLDACSALGAKLDDFADFTTFGIATALLLRTPELLDNLLCMCYVLSVFARLCFFSSGKNPVHVPWSSVHLCVRHLGQCVSAVGEKRGTAPDDRGAHDPVHDQPNLLPTRPRPGVSGLEEGCLRRRSGDDVLLVLPFGLCVLPALVRLLHPVPHLTLEQQSVTTTTVKEPLLLLPLYCCFPFYVERVDGLCA